MRTVKAQIPSGLTWRDICACFFASNSLHQLSTYYFEHYYDAMIEDGENRRRDAYEFQALACLYNYLHKNGKGVVCLERDSEKKELFKLFADKEAYSLEHFLLNDSGKYIYHADGEKVEGEYPTSIVKYIGGILNFIYIPDVINGNILGNRLLPEKIDILLSTGDVFETLSDNHKQLISQTQRVCKYSEMIISKLQPGDDQPPQYFSGYWEAYQSHDQKRIETYFKRRYAKDYLAFMNEVLNTVMQDLKERVK